MNQQQYEDMKEIMRLAREFSDKAYELMDKAGLLEQDYELELRVYQFKHEDGDVTTNRIELEPNISRNMEMYRKYRMEQVKYLGQEWTIHADPYAEKYVAIRDEDESSETDDSEGMAEDPGKPYPVDGLWISDFEHPPILDGGQ